MSKRKNTEKYYKIIDAATKIFAKKGFHQARISEIAREAKIADGTIYIYFENKDDILISLFEEQMNAVLDNMVEKISEQNNPIKKLEKFALTHLQLIEQLFVVDRLATHRMRALFIYIVYAAKQCIGRRLSFIEATEWFRFFG